MNGEDDKKRFVDLQQELEQLRRERQKFASDLAFYQRLLDTVADTVFVFDPTTGKALYWNKALRDISGLSDDAIAQRRAPDDWYDPQQLVRSEPTLRRILAGEEGQLELDLITSHGPVTTEYTASALQEVPNHPNAVVAVGRDISQRRKMEEDLQSSQAKFQDIVKSLAGVVFQLTLLPDGTLRCDYLSPAAEVLLGIPVQNILQSSSSLFDIVLPEDLPTVRHNIEVSARNLTKYSAENRMLVNGKVRWHHLDAMPHRKKDGSVVWNGISIDLTESKMAQQALFESEQRYGSLLNAIDDVVVVIDRKGQQIFANQAAANMLGVPREQLLNVPHGTMFEGQRETSFYKLLQRVLETRQAESLEDYLELAGKKRWFFMRAYPVLDGVMYITREVTKQRQLEQSLAHAQKMEAIGKLAGGIAHDFNNLLQGIQGRVSLMLQENSGDQQHLRAINEVVHSATGLTQQLLGFARGGKYQVTPIDCNTLINKCVKMVGRTRKDLRFQVELEPGVASVEADSSQLEQVLVNLLINAAQAMPQGGLVRISSHNQTLDAETAAGHNLPPGDYLRVAVSDQGQGVAPESQPHIFEPFFSTKEVGTGTGLGLASAYGIVQNHGGCLLLESQQNRGSTFWFYLPTTDKTVQPKTQQAKTTPPGTESVLLIDDERVVRDVTSHMLKRLGYTVQATASGQEALAIFGDSPATIDLVILDMILPNESALEIFTSLRQLKPSIAVLLCSGYSVDGQAQEILQQGCNGFIQKPFKLDELALKLRDIFM